MAPSGWANSQRRPLIGRHGDGAIGYPWIWKGHLRCNRAEHSRSAGGVYIPSGAAMVVPEGIIGRIHHGKTKRAHGQS